MYLLNRSLKKSNHDTMHVFKQSAPNQPGTGRIAVAHTILVANYLKFVGIL